MEKRNCHSARTHTLAHTHTHTYSHTNTCIHTYEHISLSRGGSDLRFQLHISTFPSKVHESQLVLALALVIALVLAHVPVLLLVLVLSFVTQNSDMQFETAKFNPQTRSHQKKLKWQT